MTELREGDPVWRREPCQYGCDPLRLLVKGRAGEGVRWLCASCGGEQDR